MIHCAHCKQDFEITTEDQAFYSKLAVPLPTFCSICRLQRRLVFRNERRLYQRSCDLCQQPTIGVYKPKTPFPVYCGNCWWSDKWDPLSYGQEIDWNRPFFEQFQELMNRVPKSAVLQLNNENSEYNALLAFSKNMYMCPGSYLSENCFYMRKSQNSKDCVNSAILNKCELVADSINCDTCYSSHHLINARSCSFSSYLMNCSGLQNSFMCCGLNNAQYAFKNKTYTQSQYEAILLAYQDKSPEELAQEFRVFCQTIPKRDQIQVNSEHCTGDYLFNCHEAKECFDCFDVDTGKYLLECAEVKDSMDLSMHDKEIELCYELSSGGEKNYLTKFSYCVCASPESEYCNTCFYASNCFGCDSIHARTQYCILNKQYSAGEYAQLRERLIAHMKTTGEYGEFFPAHLSPFAYNESAAQDYHPLNKAEALAQGFHWDDTLDAIAPRQASAAKSCHNCNKAFRIIPQEQVLYTRMKITEPTLCSDCRYRVLQDWKNPRALYQRHCAQCGNSITTTYAVDRPDKVLCSDCYRQVTY